MPVSSSLANSPSIEKFDPNDLKKNKSGIPVDKSAPTITKISADNIIPTNDRQFISTEEKVFLGSMLDTISHKAKHVMYKELYDRDNDGIVDIAKKSLVADVVLWENVIGKPDVPTNVIDECAKQVHTHPNIDILDLIGIDHDENLTYKGRAFKLPENLMDKNNYDVDGDGVIDKALYADSTNWENILNKPIFYTPSPHTHKGADIIGNVDASSLNGVTADKFLTKNDKISIRQISDLDDLKISVKAIYGGNATSEYDGSVDNETRIVNRVDNPTSYTNVNPTLAIAEVAYESDTYRHKIGNGVIPWNGLPYEYNTPASIRFNRYARSFITDYYDYTNTVEVAPSLVNSTIQNTASTILYSGIVKGHNNCIIGVPYNATDVFYCDYNGNNVATFGMSLSSINQKGSGWFGGVAYKSYVYCAPYNNDKILKIDSHNRTIETLDNITLDNTMTGKYVNGVLSENGLIYFAPHNSKSILEINPAKEDSYKYYQDMDIFDIDSGYCDAVLNPIDSMIYFMPKKNNKIVQFDPISKNMKVVAIINDFGTNKFSKAVLAPNGLIYCIPGYGYDNLMIFDPNTYDVKYVSFETDAYDEFRDVVVAPNNRMYFIPSGAGSSKVIEYNLHNNMIAYAYTTVNLQDRWCGGALTLDGEIVCVPYTSTNILRMKLTLKSNLNNSVLSGYFHK